MVTKTLSISEEAYNSLKSLKQGNESFTDLILRLTEKNKKGISSVLDWLETMTEEDRGLLNDLSDAVEIAISSKKKDKWRSIEL